MTNENTTRRVRSLSSQVQAFKEQIDFDTFSVFEKTHADTFCLLMAEVTILPEDAIVNIGGVPIRAGEVAEVFGMVRKDHVQLVIENMKRVNYRIQSVKTYFRTALYNSVFEIDLRLTNEAAIAEA